MERECKICNIKKSIKENFNKTGKDTYRHQCNECLSNREKEKYLNGGKIKAYENVYGNYESFFRVQLNRRNRKQTLTVEDCMFILKKQNYRCKLTGLEFILEPKNPYLPTLDRIIPGGEYNKDNIRIVCNSVNSFRNKWSDEVFFYVCKKIVENNIT
jgi:hypothetical protein